MASEPRKVSQVIPPSTVDFESGELELQFPLYEFRTPDIESVTVRLKDVRCFGPYSATQRFRVTIEEVPDGE